MTALFWGAIGICAVMSAVFLMASAWYRLSGDRVWDATHADVVGPTATGLLLFFELRCRGPFPINPTTLGAVGCSVKTPNGALWTCPGDFVQRINPEGFIAWSSLAPQSGRYEVRWYANDGKRQVHEIARATLEAPSGGPITPGTVTAIPAGLAWLRENWRAELERENALRRERGQRAA